MDNAAASRFTPKRWVLRVLREWTTLLLHVYPEAVGFAASGRGFECRQRKLQEVAKSARSVARFVVSVCVVHDFDIQQVLPLNLGIDKMLFGSCDAIVHTHTYAATVAACSRPRATMGWALCTSSREVGFGEVCHDAAEEV